jgi:uncharacterized surface protein with fasciclin (FAS1) repeats
MKHSIITAAAAIFLMQAPGFAAEKTLASFATKDAVKSWNSVNDGVMGGVSKGGASRTEQGTLLFSGELSLANNGGFASIRTEPRPLGLTDDSTIVVNARGDGRTYWIELRVSGQMGASSYRADFPTTAGQWQESRFSLKEFKPQAFGRALPFKAVEPANVTSIGFTLADKKAGPFQLEIKSVIATDGEPTAAHVSEAAAPKGTTLVDVATAAGSFKTLLAAATAADLVGVLSGEGPFTVFAPTDEAFAKLPAGTVESLVKPENRATLVAILKNHVIAGKVTLAQALASGAATTLQGSKISAKFVDGRVRVGSASLLKADLAASNGIIHVIDGVLLPAKPAAEPLSALGLIERAIERGVPLFNDGDPAACAAVYEITCEALRVIPGVATASREILTQALTESQAEKSARKQAWILRTALDQVAAAR